MAASFIKLPHGKYYLELDVASAPGAGGSNILCCVDTSGSMAGAPMNLVNSVLKDIYEKTKLDIPVLQYNTTVTTHTLSSVAASPLVAGGGTTFAAAFEAIRAHLVANVKPTTIIFMTDGQDTANNPQRLHAAIQGIKMAASAMGGMPLTFHALGFGDVHAAFMEEIRTMGNKEGIFRYASSGQELQVSFNDMFDYAMSAKEYTLQIGPKSYRSYSNAAYVGFLVDDLPAGADSTATMTTEGAAGKLTAPLVPLEAPRTVHYVRAYNLETPTTEEAVRFILAQFNELPAKGVNLLETLEVEHMLKDLTDRMMEYIALFTQIKMGQVPEAVKLKLSALRHESMFADLHLRRKLELRVAKNVEYFKKTDITGILEGFKRDVPSTAWDEIRGMREWICAQTLQSPLDMMQRSCDNVMCVGLLVKRNAAAIDSPTQGLELVNVTDVVITYDAFINAMKLARQERQTAAASAVPAASAATTAATAAASAMVSSATPPPDGTDEVTCVVGAARDRINAVVPLFIHPEHMKRARILEGIWLGHLFTLDSYGYEKQQEIGLITLLHEAIQRRTGTARNALILAELARLCRFIITESEGFRSAYGEGTYEAFVTSKGGRSSTYSLTVPLTIGYLRDDLRRAALPVYYEHVRQALRSSMNRVDALAHTKALLHGTGITTVVPSREASAAAGEASKEPDYVETSFVEYWHDERRVPVAVIPQHTAGAARRAVIDADASYVKALLPPVPPFIKSMLAFAGCDVDSVELAVDADMERARQELLLLLNFPQVPQHISRDTVLAYLDNSIQGSHDHVQFDRSEESMRVLGRCARAFKTLEGFGGLVRRYGGRRRGPALDAIAAALLSSEAHEEGVLIQEKMAALLTNRVNYGAIYTDDSICWVPICARSALAAVVGAHVLSHIEADHRMHYRRRMHLYRASGRANRHGHSNSNPNPALVYPFSTYGFSG